MSPIFFARSLRPSQNRQRQSVSIGAWVVVPNRGTHGRHQRFEIGRAKGPQIETNCVIADSRDHRNLGLAQRLNRRSA